MLAQVVVAFGRIGQIPPHVLQVPEPSQTPAGQIVPSAAKASAGQGGVTPSHVSLTSQMSTAMRQTVPTERIASDGQMPDVPVHDSCWSQRAAGGRHTVPAIVTASAGHAFETPLQLSGVSHEPAEARQPVPETRTTSAGQTVLTPSQFSCTSQAAATSRQGVADDCIPSAGQSAELPVHVSSASHGPTGARQEVPPATRPTLVQTGAPLEQSICPRSQARPVGQGVPFTHGAQVPVPLHTPPGHIVPATARTSGGQAAPLPLQVSFESHASTPVRHRLAESKPSAGQAVLTPSQFSTRSQGPAGVRHTVPGGAGPAGTHTGVPPVQSRVPASHATPVAHGAPGEHETQAPSPSQTPPAHVRPAGCGASAGQVTAVPSQISCASHSPVDARHTVPAVMAPIATQTGLPLAQLVMPSSHALPVAQGAPSMQNGTQRPAPSQVPRPMQAVPAAANRLGGHAEPDPSQASGTSQASTRGRHTAPEGAGPVAAHTGLPLAQLIAPTWQAAVTQGSPGTHMLQPPDPSHAMPTPQRTPDGMSVVAMHTELPIGHASVPEVQGLPVLQIVPAMHSLHSPAPLHTPPVPQPVPGVTSVSGTQTGLPEPQSVRPVVQGLPVLQIVPPTQTSHAPPPLQASPSPQVVPRGRSAPGLHTVVIGSGQVERPVVQGLPVLQTLSEMHSLQTSPPHTPPVPQGAPSIGVSGTHTALPEAQSVRPVVQGLPVLQTAPIAQTLHVPSAAHV